MQITTQVPSDVAKYVEIKERNNTDVGRNDDPVILIFVGFLSFILHAMKKLIKQKFPQPEHYHSLTTESSHVN
jgi:hypothetical protein